MNDDLEVQLADAVANAKALALPDPSTALAVVGDDAPTVKLQMAARRSDIIKARQELKRVQQEMEQRLQDQLAELEEIVGPLAAQVKLLEEGIWTVNLYLGRDEEIVTLAEGAPAPASTPITVRQLVLSMDEECMVGADQGGIDYRHIEEFDAWITSDPAHLQQVLPEQRGVVVLVPRRDAKGRSYGDPWSDNAARELNNASYWLIRNGDMLYRMSTNFEVGKHLIPLRDEFTSFFSRWEGHGKNRHRVDLQPGTHEWLKAEKNADEHQRHFMRSALILQGLIDRTACFHPLPAPQVSLLQPESYDEGHVQVITDAELMLTDGHVPFYDWLKALNQKLVVGMRIIGSFTEDEFRPSYGSGRDEYGHSRISPQHAEGLQRLVLHRIEDTAPDGGLRFKFERTDKRYGYEFKNASGYEWGDWGSWPYKNRASCTVYPTDRSWLPFDLVTVEEMRYYMTTRTDRHAYINLLPLLTAAIAAKEAEEAEEAPFRQMLAGIISVECAVPVSEAAEALPELVAWWKLANRYHRPLIGDQNEQAKAVRMITTEFKKRRREDPDRDAKLVKAIRATGDVVWIGRRTNGTLVWFTAANEANVFVHQTEAKPTKLDTPAKHVEWTLPGGGWRRLRSLWASERWTEWDHTAKLAENLTDPEIEALALRIVEEFPEQEDAEGTPFIVTYQNERPYGGWSRTREFALHLYKNPPTLGDHDRPLTGPDPSFHTFSRDIPWQREGKQAILRWDRSRNTEERSSEPWVNNQTIVWIDDAVMAKVTAGHAAVDAREAELKPFEQKAGAVREAIQAAWAKREEQVAFERFMEDYADATLWEDHKKSVRTAHWPYEWWTGPSWERRRSPLYRMISRLVESGFQLDGMSVEQMETLYRTLGDSAQDMNLGKLPEDIGDLVVKLKKKDR